MDVRGAPRVVTGDVDVGDRAAVPTPGVNQGYPRNGGQGDAGLTPGGAAASIGPGGEPMRTIRASLVALPFIGLAALVAPLSVLIGPMQ